MLIGRKPGGEIYGMWTVPQPQDEFHQGIEQVPDDHPDLVAFLAPKPKVEALTVESLAAALKSKGVLTDGDLDAAKE